MIDFLSFYKQFYNKHFIITYQGDDIISDNLFYSAKHWTIRSGLKNKWRGIFSELLLEAKVRPINDMSLLVEFNSRHDVDNLSIFGKILADTMKGKYIPDDNKKFYKSRQTVYNPSLPKNTVKFHILGNDN